jgi:hypothetical protein
MKNGYFNMALELSEEFFNELSWLVKEGYHFFLEQKQGGYFEPGTYEDLEEYADKIPHVFALMLNHK